MEVLNSTNFSNFTTINSNKEYMSSAYSQKEPVLYYNEADPKQAKKKKIFTLSLIGASVLTTGALAVGIFKHKNPQKTKEAFEKLFKKSSSAIKDFNFKEKFSNLFSNIINVKDDLWDRFSKKTAHTPLFFIDKIGDKITGVYKKSQKITHGNKFNEIVKELNKNNDFNLKDFDSWFDDINKYMRGNFQEKRITKGLFNKEFAKSMLGDNIADKQLGVDWIKEQYLSLDGLDSKIKKLAEEYNNIIGTLLPKLRDINCGSAPTDLLTIITAAGGLGTAALTAKDKEERKSIIVNLGIPLIGTLAGSTYCTMKSLSGTKGLIYGAIIGQVASIGAKIVDKCLLQSKDEVNKTNYNA